VPILNRRTAPRWLLFGLVQSIVSLLPFAWVDMLGVPAAQSMTFGVLAISTIFLAISLRRDVIPGWEGPYLPYWLWMLVPATLTVLAIELPLFQRMLLTTSLTGSQWLAVWAIALIVPVVMEIEKAIRRARVSRA